MVMSTRADRILSSVPDARLELLRGIGHCPQVEAADRFTELLLEVCAQPESEVA